MAKLPPMSRLVLVFRIEANIDGGEVGSVMIMDPDDPDAMPHEEMPEFMSRREAQALAKRRGLPFREEQRD